MYQHDLKADNDTTFNNIDKNKHYIVCKQKSLSSDTKITYNIQSQIV